MSARASERRVLAVAAGLLALLAAATFLLLLGQTRSRNLLLLEYQASRLAGALTELYHETGSIDLEETDDDVLGFGIYDTDGNPVARDGTAPDRLETQPGFSSGGDVLLQQDRLRLVRPTGGMRLLPGNEESYRSGRGRMTNPGFSRPGRVVLIDYGLDDFRRRNLLMLLPALIYVGAVAVLLLVTFRMARRIRSYREREERQERLVRLGEAARTIAHEIRNPLGAISVQRAILLRRLPEEYHPGLNIMGEEIGRISALVERVRDFLRDPVGKPEPVPVSRLIARLTARSDVPVELEDGLPEGRIVRVDPEKLRSVIENLIGNAAESMDGTGSVEVHLDEKGGNIRIHVLDRGKGIPPELHERIFDPFFTTKENGSGVGLAVARRFTHAAGGDLSVRNRPGGGTVFTVSLPISRAEGGERV